MKKIILIMVLILAFLLTGCTTGSYSTVLSNENKTTTSWSMTYQKFNGLKTTTINVEENTAVSVEIVSEDGKLNLSIEDMDGKAYYQGTDIPTSSFVVNLDKAGKYKVRVEGGKHSGSFDISWGR